MAETDWKEQCLHHIGRTGHLTNEISPYFANGLSATLDDYRTYNSGDSLPPLFHWVYFNKAVKTERLKEDGHEKLGDFLPPVRYPRRMWAGSKIEFTQPIVIGKVAERTSTIENVTFKQGKSGPLCFVTVKHEISQGDVSCLTDTHTIVYREPPQKSGAAPDIPTVSPPQVGPSMSVNSTVLFRYSALTFNSHRIHYDKDYVRDVEGYPGLVVHGPLIATLLMRHAMAEQSKERLPKRFTFQGKAPVFEDDLFTLGCENTDNNSDLSLVKSDGTTAFSATVTWAA